MKKPQQRIIKAWTVIFNGGYADKEITYWSVDLHPIFTKKKFALNWAGELIGNKATKNRPHTVECTITYKLPAPKTNSK